MSTANHDRCVTCGASLQGPYCSQCGEAAHAHDYSVGHFIGELVESLVHIDGRIGATFRALLLRPGLLARDYLAGRRKPYMGPVQLFLVCTVLAFVLQPFSGFAPFTTTLEIHTNGAYWWAGMARRMADARIAARHTTWAQYASAFDETAHLQGKTLVIVMVPAFALGLWALYGRSRRFYGEHLVIAFYIYAFFLVWMGVSTLAGMRLGMAAARLGFPVTGDGIDNVVSTVLLAVMALYVFACARRVYAGSLAATAFKTLALVGWMAAVYIGYKFVLFFTTFYAT
jgi:Protein of unknown function (DUF3667)